MNQKTRKNRISKTQNRKALFDYLTDLWKRTGKKATPSAGKLS